MFGRWLVRARWLVVAGWLAATVAALVYLPAPEPVVTSALTTLLPEDAPALQVEQRATEQFGLPALARVSAVIEAPEGLPPDAQTEILETATRAVGGGLPEFPEVLAAVPVVDPVDAAGAGGRVTTAVVYLFIDPELASWEQVGIARGFAAAYLQPPSGGTVSVTGPFAALEAQAREINRALPWVEAATVLVVVLIVSLRFRTVLAPAVTLVGAAVAYVIALRGISWLGREWGMATPEQLEPLLVVLLIGLMTDYAVFLMSAVREEMARGVARREAVATAATEIAPIVVTAALAVAAGAGSLLVAEAALFRQLGPGMAVTVLVTMVVAVTLLPALLAVSLGTTPRRARWRTAAATAAATATAAPSSVPGDRLRRGVLRQVVRRPVAAVVLLTGLVLLAAGSWPLKDVRLGVNLIENLPAESEPSRGLAAVTPDFPPGVIAPTMVVVEGEGVTDRRAELAELQRSLADQPGVGAVVGPAQLPTGEEFGAVYAPSGGAARYFLALDQSPYGADAIDTVSRLQDRAPELARQAGLEDVEIGWAGDTVVSEAVIDMAEGDLLRVGAVALLIQLAILVAFLRSLLVPVVVLVLTTGAVTAALGSTSWLFSTYLGVSDPTFFVPIAVAVLLLAFGSDYNIFLVGRIRNRAQQVRSLRRAIVEGGAGASRAIGSAGLALAGSFGMLAIIRLDTFQFFAVAMVVGVLLDTFLVRSYLVPAALSLVGRRAASAAGADPVPDEPPGGGRPLAQGARATSA